MLSFRRDGSMSAHLSVGIQVVTNLFVMKMNVIGIE
jgi:hypothetical protein